MKKAFLICFYVCMAFCACNPHSVSPKDIQKDIEGDIRYRISLANVMIQDYNTMNRQTAFDEALSELTVALSGKSVAEMKMEAYNDSISGFVSEVEDVGKALLDFEDYYIQHMFKEEGHIGRREVLRFLSEDNSNKYHLLASKVLGEYDKTLVLLSDYTEVETSSNYKVWIFKELNTDITSQVVYDIENQKWDCRPDPASVERYMKKHVNRP